MGIYGYMWTYIVIIIYIYIYIYVLLAGVVLFVPSSVSVALHLPMLEFPALTPPLSTILLELVLWECSYGPWDHFMFSVNGGI